MHAAAAGHSTLGIPASVGRDFVNASHGMKVGQLPKRKKPPQPHQSPMPFGSLAPGMPPDPGAPPPPSDGDAS